MAQDMYQQASEAARKYQENGPDGIPNTGDEPTETADSATEVTLDPVNDPDKVFADMTRQDYLDYIRDYRDFEKELLEKASTDTSLIDSAREDAAMARERTAGIAQRNLSRYGTALTPAQQREMQRNINRGTTLGGIQSIADARIAQRDANQKLLADLINIGQGVNRTSLQQLGSAAADATQRKNAYTQARAQYKANKYSTIGGLGAMAIMALPFL
tara:strand:+ start:1844 stop:2491 length:648 start_codon:yes stop_codon:yes gene_type:complete